MDHNKYLNVGFKADTMTVGIGNQKYLQSFFLEAEGLEILDKEDHECLEQLACRIFFEEDFEKIKLVMERIEIQNNHIRKKYSSVFNGFWRAIENIENVFNIEVKKNSAYQKKPIFIIRTDIPWNIYDTGRWRSDYIENKGAPFWISRDIPEKKDFLAAKLARERANGSPRI